MENTENNEVKKVTIKIVSPRGHDVQLLEPEAALAQLKTFTETGKWVFKDGQLVQDVNTLTIENIVNAEAINVTNQLIGG